MRTYEPGNEVAPRLPHQLSRHGAEAHLAGNPLANDNGFGEECSGPSEGYFVTSLASLPAYNAVALRPDRTIRILAAGQFAQREP